MGQTTSIPVPGPRGDKGDSIIGPKGDSIIGPPGKDSTVPGPRGDIGPKGDKGDSIIGPPGKDATGIPAGNLMYFQSTTLGTSPVGILMSSNASTDSGKADANNSIIINDTTTAAVRALALYGNTSSGTKKVNVYDNLFVNGNINTVGDIFVPTNKRIYLRGDKAGDMNHSLGYTADGDGPQLKGFSGGKLSSNNGDNLLWNNAGDITVKGKINVGVGGVSLSTNPSGDLLIVAGGKTWKFGSNGTLYKPGPIEGP